MLHILRQNNSRRARQWTDIRMSRSEKNKRILKEETPESWVNSTNYIFNKKKRKEDEGNYFFRDWECASLTTVYYTSSSNRTMIIVIRCQQQIFHLNTVIITKAMSLYSKRYFTRHFVNNRGARNEREKFIARQGAQFFPQAIRISKCAAKIRKLIVLANCSGISSSSKIAPISFPPPRARHCFLLYAYLRMEKYRSSESGEFHTTEVLNN